MYSDNRVFNIYKKNLTFHRNFPLWWISPNYDVLTFVLANRILKREAVNVLLEKQ